MTTNKSKNKLSQIFFDSLFFFSKKDVIIVLTASSYSNNQYINNTMLFASKPDAQHLFKNTVDQNYIVYSQTVH